MMYRILLIEDERSLRIGLLHALRADGYQVKATASGQEGISLIEAEEFDLVVTDLRLPDLDGIQVLKAVLEIAPETGVIIITGFAEVKTAVEAMREGAYDYLSKPFDPDELLLVIGRFVKHRELESENLRLKEELGELKNFEQIVGNSPAMRSVFERIAIVARTDSSVMIYGESGTGKELAANALHNLSPRKDKSFVKLNCAAIPDTLIESELFGHEKGAFTGAIQRRKGKFEVADGGTIFLDEIGDLPLALQAKMLRVLENRTFERLGGNDPITVDVRTLYATSRNLKEEMKAGRFREDLYYRLNVMPMTLPPLRERKEDVPLLVRHFLDLYAKKVGKSGLTVSRAAMDRFLSYPFPGNVRELKYAVEMAAMFCGGSVIEPRCLPNEIRGEECQQNLPEAGGGALPVTERVRAFERELIAQALQESDGRKQETARKLGISRGTLWRKLKEHGFPTADSDSDE
jgi:DNA-binding NtrC family response regulator